MKLADLTRAGRLERELSSLQERRGTWQTLTLTGSPVSRRLNANGASSDRLPLIDDDIQMHTAIVKAIVGEYERRIVAIETELKDLGVDL